MKYTHRTSFLLIFIAFHLSAFGQWKELNLYVGAQSLNITRYNELEVLGDGWNFKNARAAFSSEFSANYYPTKNERFFLQTGLKYHRLKGQHNTVPYITRLNGISLDGELDAEYGEFKYGFDLQYFLYFISPSVKLNLSKGFHAVIGVGAMMHLATTRQEGFQIFINPDDFTWTTNQFTGKHRDYGLSYNLSTSLSKDVSDKLSLSLKGEYNFVKLNIGEDGRSIYDGALLDEENITVPIPKQNIDLSGLNIMLGASYRFGNP